MVARYAAGLLCHVGYHHSSYIIYVIRSLVISLGAQELDGRLIVAIDEDGKRIARGVPDLAERPLQPGRLLRCEGGDKALFDQLVADRTANKFEEIGIMGLTCDPLRRLAGRHCSRRGGPPLASSRWRTASFHGQRCPTRCPAEMQGSCDLLIFSQE